MAAKTITAISNTTAIVVRLRRARFRCASYRATGDWGAISTDAGATAGKATGSTGGADGAVRIATGSIAGEAGFRGGSLTGMIVDGEAVEVASAELAELRATSLDGTTAVSGSPLASGICTFSPQVGQIPRFPASSSLTWSLCPLGHVKRIPIARRTSVWIPL
jgi:hypothetical protein